MSKIRLGLAVILWSDATGDHVLELNAPLRGVRPSVRIRRWARDSLDYTARNVVTLGDGVYEIEGTIRYMDAGQTLIDMLLAGIKGSTLTYIPDMDNPDRYYDVWLISPVRLPTPQMDSDRGFPGFEDLEIRVRFRRTDGTAFV